MPVIIPIISRRHAVSRIRRLVTATGGDVVFAWGLAWYRLYCKYDAPQSISPHVKKWTGKMHVADGAWALLLCDDGSQI